MKKLVAGILIMGLSIGTLYGCGSEQPAEDDAAVETVDSGDTEEVSEEPQAADATAPVVQWTADYLFTNSLSGQAAAGILSYEDESDCTIEMTRFSKLSNLDVLDDAKIKSYTDSLNKNTSDELLARTPNKAAGEGIYSAVVSVTDAAGNTTAREILVIYDKTAPVFSGLTDRTITQEDVTSEPQVDLSAYTVSDNVDGDLNISLAQAQLELEDTENHVYTLHLSMTDRAGNEAIDYCTFTVNGKAESKPEETAQASTTPASSSTTDSNKLQQSAGTQATQPEQKKVIQYQTTTTFNMAEGTQFNESMAKEVLGILNQRRAENGLDALTWDNDLTTVAKVRSLEIVGNFSHTRPDGRSFYSALDEQYITYAWGGENLACGQTSAAVAMSEWMDSPTHKENILRSEFHKVGVACYYDPNSIYKYYWVQIFSD